MDVKSLKTRRGYASLTLLELAKGSGVNVSLLSRYENGLIKPGIKNYIKIDEYLKTKGV